ncbi:Non-specific cytotoxic cell receptor protein 1 like protein [Chelonia mydas]|uniref:Non-specific cytotoxic cell receptor protein 1 like protein n=1 Tax=Chelonia mydas TaxID=8469 RepID=M7AR95_CHEMY|nr:Non-specific cytotoxic cell receptor protein 1 like protein [Chelonia mydas]
MAKAPGCPRLRRPSCYLPTALFFAALCGSGAVLRRKGVNISEPAPHLPPNSPQVPLESLGNFSGWAISTEELPPQVAGKKPGSEGPRFSWCVKQQQVDLLAEGLWEELLDSYQPNVTVMDWYWLSFECPGGRVPVAATAPLPRSLTPLREFHHEGPEHGASREEKNWCHVSHVFHGYGPGVRYVHFQHRTLNAETPGGLCRTRATDSSVSVQLRD